MTLEQRWGVVAAFTDTSERAVTADPASEAEVLAILRDGRRSPPPPGARFVHRGQRVRSAFTVRTEDNREVRVEGRVPRDLPFGYHERLDGTGPSVVICSPQRCFLPADLRLGGWAAQLPVLRSRHSWGIGDLADLRTFGAWVRERGPGFVLLNPLAAPAPVVPVEPSPYFPTSRRFRTPLAIAVEEVPGAERLGDRLEALAREGRALNRSPLIDRDRSLPHKLDALAEIHRAEPHPPGFARFGREQGTALTGFATFCALAEVHGRDWRQWPAALRDPFSPGVAAESRRLRARIDFHRWLQWVIDQQLAAAGAVVDLVHDLPIGVDPGGADTWAGGSAYAAGVSVGAPPDLFNPRGQDWSVAPFHPWHLRAAAYAPLVALLRSTLRGAAGLRIDHVMGFFRLYWIPEGRSPRDGVYVSYPVDEILDIVALESHRAGAWVVGEDLGTVGPGVREQMAARDMLSSRLLIFEDCPPARLPVRAMSGVTTHDLPTIAGLRSGADDAARERIGLDVDPAATGAVVSRLRDAAGPAWDESLPDTVLALHTALAASPSMLAVASIEDAARVAERPNMPGTRSDRWPNWSRPRPGGLEAVLRSPLARRLAAVIGRRPDPPEPSPPADPAPRATPSRGRRAGSR